MSSSKGIYCITLAATRKEKGKDILKETPVERPVISVDFSKKLNIDELVLSS